LDDDPRSPRFIETLARRGYRLIERPSPLIDSREASSEAEVAATATQCQDGPLLRIRQRGPWLIVASMLMLGIAPWLLMTDGVDRAPTGVDLAENGIAVLPFTNLSDDPEFEYFSDGLSEELIHRLAGVEALAVVAHTSAFAFKGSNKDI